jgi:hypothetical protein
MVSSTLPSPTKVAHLSYADHAKKAQSIKSPISTHPHRIGVQSLPTASGISDPSSDQSVSTSKTTSSHPVVDAKSDPGVNPIRYTDSSSLSSSTTDTSNGRIANGDTRASSDLAEKALSVVAAHTSSQRSPVVNVWNLRKQQLAAARAALTTALAKETSLESQAVSPSSESMSQTHVLNISASKSSSAPNTSHGPSALMNGVTLTSQGAEHDPFVVRSGVNIMKTLPPPVNDTDNWPQVGKSAALIQPNANPASRVDDSAIRNESEGDQVSTNMSRKSAFLIFLDPFDSLPCNPRYSCSFFSATINYFQYHSSFLLRLEPQAKRLNGYPYLPKNFKLLLMRLPNLPNDLAEREHLMQITHIWELVRAVTPLVDLLLGRHNHEVGVTQHRCLLLNLEFKVVQKVYNPAHIFLESDDYRLTTHMELPGRAL